ncbi:NAD-dependent epimerase/dehydratase family protein [Neobacillus notoginsengisoli]|uniref:NAD-dependent epimerase/dehydratase family protein n=1 Tax=Neobacillus notoginsengisoli TaxID=1578198 RepID=A0A417YYV8_9BACI|nr:NAD(P)H-binding protein [Neobacillus notoginsengisoli]RHW43100.1 NAD-dependent epimerase/dehydratase family protein [Neobacillus notoginsengisoli]
MKICLFGATGRVGSVILENYLRDGHGVHALVRSPDKLELKNPRLKIFHGDAINEHDVRATVKGCDAVISTLNTGGGTTLSDSMPHIIHAMKENSIRRIILISTAGITQARSEPELYRFQSAESRRKTTKDAEEHLKAWLILKESGLDWTAVCPTYLPVGERLGTYRVGRNMLPENPSSISIYDTADFACKQLESDQYLHCRAALTY